MIELIVGYNQLVTMTLSRQRAKRLVVVETDNQNYNCKYRSRLFHGERI